LVSCAILAVGGYFYFVPAFQPKETTRSRYGRATHTGEGLEPPVYKTGEAERSKK